jgi:hypothetical protein
MYKKVCMELVLISEMTVEALAKDIELLRCPLAMI